MKRRNFLYIAVIIFNLISIYFIIDFFFYDEIIICATIDDKRIIDPRDFAFLSFVTSLTNLYFLAFVIMERAFENKT